MSLGGAGYCSKTRPPEELLEIVAAVGAGRMVFPMLDVRTLAANPVAGLTERERDLLGALCEGATNADLARRFGISLQTVKFHLKKVYAKIGVSNRAGAVALYLSQVD
jgi:two-component system nitrate/nitrite response regulator NarP